MRGRQKIPMIQPFLPGSPAADSMFLNKLYFRLKPLIPRCARLAVRRWFVQHKRDRVGDIWPIMPGSDRAPEGWQGWPNEKTFAFVLTHDVESQEGLERVQQLAEMEMELGFRSSFNLIPEGRYTVTGQLRDWLTARGFEVGVHDLNHDGRLFSSQERFRLKAQRINNYLKGWDAVGFRSGYMLRNLDWIQDLNISYDACTFDTDPFEPQPDGVNTIFPFWVPRRREGGSPNSSSDRIVAGRDSQRQVLNQPRRGYVELPYTLPQDSTLFLMLREKTNDIWKQKLDWIAKNGGMALLNVHPDYLHLDETGPHSGLYSYKHYRDFLEYVNANYAGQFWHALPREVAHYYRTIALSRPALGRSPANRPIQPFSLRARQHGSLLASCCDFAI